MRRIILYFIVLTLLFFLMWSDTRAQNFAADPDKAAFIYDDLRNFNRAFKMLPEEGDTVPILQAEYFDRATPGLREFIRKYDLKVENLARAIKKHPLRYASLSDLPHQLAAEEETFRKAFARLKQYIPNTFFPPTYFLVGDWRGISSASAQGMLISVEKFQSAKGKATLITHELVHMQQAMAQGIEQYMSIYGHKKSLLAFSIREGTAEFFADLVTGKTTQEQARPYVIKHEKALWERFSKEMYGPETGDWMWKQPENPDQPPQIGYIMGFRIVEAYYEHAANKAEAVKEILSVSDYPAFLKRSGYAERFTEKK